MNARDSCLRVTQRAHQPKQLVEVLLLETSYVGREKGTWFVSPAQNKPGPFFVRSRRRAEPMRVRRRGLRLGGAALELLLLGVQASAALEGLALRVRGRGRRLAACSLGQMPKDPAISQRTNGSDHARRTRVAATKKGPSLFCGKHPPGRSGKINQVPFPYRSPKAAAVVPWSCTRITRRFRRISTAQSDLGRRLWGPNGLGRRQRSAREPRREDVRCCPPALWIYTIVLRCQNKFRKKARGARGARR